MARSFAGFSGTTHLSSSTVPFNVKTTTDMTFAAWYNSAMDTGDRQCIVSIGTSSSTDAHGVFLYLSAAGVVNCRRSNIGVAAASASSATNTWEHAAATFTGETARAAYLNGANKGTNTFDTTGLITVDSNLTRVGLQARNNTTSWPFSGSIAEVGIWDTPLTDDEIASLGKGVSPLLIRPQNLVAYWPTWGRNDPEPDYVGGINLTVTAATQAAHTRIFYPTKEKIFIPAAAGGTTYTRSYSDNLAIQDAFSRLSTANRNYSDNKGISDSILRKSDANRIYSDNEGLNNPFSRQSTANRSYSDNKGLSDNYQRQSTANRNYSENEGLADNYSRTSDSNRNYTDNPALTDTYQRQSTGNRVYTDLLGLLDSFSRVSDGLRQYSDTIGIADTFSRLSNSLRQYSDTTALSDTLSRQVNSLRAYSDTTGVSDSYQRVSNALRNFTDLLGITDVVTLELIAAGVYNLLVIDSLGISDNYSRTSNASRALSDNLALNDQYQRIVQSFRILSDTLGTSDQYQRLVNHLRSVTDNLGILDTADLDIAILIIVSAVIRFIPQFMYVQSVDPQLPAVQQADPKLPYVQPQDPEFSKKE